MDLRKVVRRSEDVPEAEVEYLDGFKVTLRFVHRSAFTALAEKFRKLEWNTVTHAREERVDTARVNAEFIERYVVGWKGLTPEILVKMIPITDEVDFSEVTEIPFTQENAKLLMGENADFESFVVQMATDVSNFQSAHKEAISGN